MKKRYQVFISSTFADLQEERRQVLETILQLECFPAGMELFPASNDEQFEFIKKVIDDSDYYVVIIGGKYGSVTSDGISFTELEYDYAVSKGVPVLTFVHSNPEAIPLGRSEIDETKRKKLEAFRNKATANKLAKLWRSPQELSSQVILSLTKAIRDGEALGWVRGAEFNNEQLLEQINSLRMQNSVLEAERTRAASERPKDVEGLAFGSDQFKIRGIQRSSPTSTRNEFDATVTWNDVFNMIGPHLFEPKSYLRLKGEFANALKVRLGRHGYNLFEVNDENFQTIKIQLLALGLITVSAEKAVKGGIAEFIQMTNAGLQYLKSIRTVKLN